MIYIKTQYYLNFPNSANSKNPIVFPSLLCHSPKWISILDEVKEFYREPRILFFSIILDELTRYEIPFTYAILSSMGSSKLISKRFKWVFFYYELDLLNSFIMIFLDYSYYIMMYYDSIMLVLDELTYFCRLDHEINPSP